MFKRIICMFLAVIAIAMVVPMGVYGAEADDEWSYKNLLFTSIEKDLSEVDLSAYIVDSSLSNVSIVALAEQGFNSYTDKDYSDCALYVYVYNPTGDYVDSTAKNNIQLKRGKDYKKYNLLYVSANDAKTMIKFRVLLDQDFYSALSISRREYSIGSIELNHVKSGVRDYKVGGKYVFTGYGKNSKLVSVETFEVVSLKIYYTTFRNTASNLAYRNQLTSVYFSIPNKLLKKYDYNLYGIDVEYEKYYTKPFVVTNNFTLYSQLSNADARLLDKTENGDYHSPYIANGLYYMTHNNEYYYTTDLPVSINRYNYIWSYNYELYAKKLTNISYGTNQVYYSYAGYEQSRILPVVIYQKGAYGRDYWVSQETVSEAIDKFLSTSVGKNEEYKYPDVSEYESEEVYTFDSDYYHRFLFEPYVLENDLITKTYYDAKNTPQKTVSIDVNTKIDDMIAYKDANSWWEKLAERGLSALWTILKNDESFTNIRPIQKITTAEYLDFDDETFSKKYYVSEQEIPQIKERVLSAEKKGETMYLFRVDVAPYYSVPLTTTIPVDGSNVGRAFMVREHVYMGFDVIDLKFVDDSGEIVKVPVTADPVNVIGGLESDVDSTEENIDIAKKIEEIIEKFKEVMKSLLMIFAIAFLFILLLPLVRDYGKGLIDNISKSIKKQNNKHKNMKRGKRK